MKNVLQKSMILLIVVASLGTFSFKLYAPALPYMQEGLNDPDKLHEVYIGQTTDQCSTGKLKVRNSAGAFEEVPSNGISRTVDVKVDSEGYWYWRCGSENEKSRESLCAKVTRLKITHKNGTITFKCYNHQ